MFNQFGKLPLILIVAMCASCASSYDFRNEDRPEYQNTVSTTELTSMQAEGATVLLKDEGFDVYSLEGGIEGWKSSGQQTVNAE